MACTIVPSILSVGLIGMLLAMYTPLFRIIGYLFYPFAALVQLPEALPAAQALATSIAEMYLPCAFVMDCSAGHALCCSSRLHFGAAVFLGGHSLHSFHQHSCQGAADALHLGRASDPLGPACRCGGIDPVLMTTGQGARMCRETLLDYSGAYAPV